jgi:hypothetical protein
MLLEMLVFGALGQWYETDQRDAITMCQASLWSVWWYLIFRLVGMTIFFGISVLVSSTMIHVNRNSGSDDNHLPFTYLPSVPHAL